MTLLSACLAGLARCVRIFTTLVLLVSVALNFVNIIGRYFFNAPLEWGEEVMLFMMVAMVFFGAVVISAQGRHIRMDLMITLMPPRLQRIAIWLGVLAEGLVAAFIVYVGVPVINDLIEFDQRADASGLPMALPQAIVPLGLALITIICAARLVLMLGPASAQPAGGSSH